MLAKIIAIVGVVIYIRLLFLSITYLSPTNLMPQIDIAIFRLSFLAGIIGNFFYWFYLRKHKVGRNTWRDSGLGFVFIFASVLLQFLLLFFVAVLSN